MRSHLVSATVALAVATLAPLAHVAAQNNNSIHIDDFAQGSRGVSLTSTAPLRRGVTSRVTISKDFIDLVPSDQIALTGGGNLSNLTKGRNVNGMGMIAFDITISGTQALGTNMNLKVGLVDNFKFTTVSRGQVTSVTRNPEPSTIAATTPWTATIVGTDMGGVEVLPIQCHTIAYSNRSAAGVTATITRNASCSTTAFGVALQPVASNDPPSFNLANGSLAGFQFQYAPSGVACVSNPNLGAPSVRQPVSNSVIQFQSGTLSPANVTITWEPTLNNGTTAPNNEFVITRQDRTSPIVTVGPVTGTSTTVTGQTATLRFAVPSTHTFSIRARNCGQDAPSTTVKFSTQYQ